MAKAMAEQPGWAPGTAPENPSPNRPETSLAHAERAIVDVWSRTEPKYRVRALVLLAVNLLLFCGLCVFTHWLHFGVLFDFSLASYAAPFRFWGADTQNLNDFMLYPISVHQTPMHGVVLGLLVASIVGVPISVAILYRFACALPFIAAVFLLAHMPWMAVTLTGSCILAAVRPFRMSFRFGSALVGLLPVVVYLVLASRGSSDTVSAVTAPEFNVLLFGPWILAVLGACGMLGVILAIARLVNYRPGAVSPVMAVMFATPLALFHLYVGADELAYRILELDYGPRAERFEPVQDATPRIAELLQEWSQTISLGPGQRATLLAVWSDRPEDRQALKQRIVRRFLLELLAERDRANEACKKFVADYPHSRYLANVLFIQARVLDTRLDERRLLGDGAERELYTDFPHVASEAVWRSLWNHFPEAPLAVAAGLRVAQLRWRAGEVAAAAELLRETLLRAERLRPRPAETQPVRRLLQGEPPESSLDFEPEPYRFEARRLLELIEANRDDPQFGVTPLRDYAALDQHRVEYPGLLLRLAERSGGSWLHDNLLVRWALTLAERDNREDALRKLVERSTDPDALPEAHYWLADLEIQSLGPEKDARRAAGLRRLRLVADDYPHSIWGERAGDWLRKLEPAAPAATRVREEGQ